jgi:hypothetical protein
LEDIKCTVLKIDLGCGRRGFVGFAQVGGLDNIFEAERKDERGGR